MLVLRIKRSVSYLRKFFGSNCIQSPFVYELICDVVSNRSAFYAYTDLRDHLRRLSRGQLKLARLLFRLANWQQPTEVYLPAGSEAYEIFLRSGCQRTQVRYYSDIAQISHAGRHTLIIADCLIPHRGIIGHFLLRGLLGASTILLINIYKNKDTLRRWREICALPQATIALDLYHCGIVLHAADCARQYHTLTIDH